MTLLGYLKGFLGTGDAHGGKYLSRQADGKKAGVVSLESLNASPPGSLLVSDDGEIAWRRVGPSKSEWQRQKPSAKSSDGWAAAAEPAGLKTFQNIVRALQNESFHLVEPR